MRLNPAHKKAGVNDTCLDHESSVSVKETLELEGGANHRHNDCVIYTR